MRERDIFIEALELEDAPDRSRYLDKECGSDSKLRLRVERLLEQHERPGSCVLDRMAQISADVSLAVGEPGQVIGRYKLLELIGEGGFGDVWMAEQKEPVKRRVALKIIKLGMDTKQVIARFETERQALAMMNHENIATILDAGATDAGRPYFVMELVRGVPVTEYCNSEKLDIRQRLELFTKICNAIQHAHQKGIIHRDIKPNNVLVTLYDGKPVPKIIDFGIAKATDAELTEKTLFTEHRQIIGTPEYMSPEQAEFSGLDIDTRSDVYSLGVLLYELLTGAAPFDSATLRNAGLQEMLRIIREEEPKKPSTRISSMGDTATSTALNRRADIRKLGMLFCGDLDWIAMKCLEKDRTRRYASAKELADEILRHLHDEPVAAGPPSTGYRLRKFVRRNRGAVIAAATVIATMAAGITGTSMGMVRALDEKRRAEAAQELAEIRAEENAQLADFHSEMLRRFNLQELGDRISQEYIDLLRQAWAQESAGTQNDGARLNDESENIVSEFENHLAMVNSANVAKVVVGDYILASAADAASTQFADSPLLEASIRWAIGRNYADVGLFDDAEKHLRWSLETRQQELPPDSLQIAESAFAVAGVLFQKGRNEEAEKLLRMAADSCDFGATSNGLDLKAKIFGGLGSLEVKRGAYEAAELLFREVLDGVPEDSPQAPRMLSLLATIEYRRRDFGNAELLLRQAIEKRTHFPTYRVDQLSDMSSLGAVLKALGKHEDAERTYRQALAKTRKVLGDEHPNVAVVTMNLAEVLVAQDKLSEAEPLFLHALSIIRKTQGDKHEHVAILLSNLAVLLSKSDRLEEAEVHYREAAERFRQLRGDADRRTVDSYDALERTLLKLNKYSESETLFREVLERRRKTLGDKHASTLMSVNNLGNLLHSIGQRDEAQLLYREAIEGRRQVLGNDHQLTLASINNLAVLLTTQGKFAEAEPLLREAVDGYKRAMGKDHPSTVNSIYSLGGVLYRQGKLVEAAPVLRETFDGYRRTLGEDHPDTLNAAKNLGVLLRNLKRYRDSEETLLAAAKHSKKPPASHELRRSIKMSLIKLYELWHEAEPGSGHDAKAAIWRSRVETKKKPNSIGKPE